MNPAYPAHTSIEMPFMAKRMEEKMEKKRYVGALLLAAGLFWKFMYPQYSLPEKMYEVKEADGTVLSQDGRRDFAGILSADKESVTLRFAALEQFQTWFGEKEE